MKSGEERGLEREDGRGGRLKGGGVFNQFFQKFYNFSTTDYPFPMAYGFRILGGSGTTGIEMVLIDDVYAVPKIAEDQYITVVDSKGCTARQPYGISVSPGIKRGR